MLPANIKSSRSETGKPLLVATDMEGCLIPEIWIGLAQKTGIDELKLTTRDIPDYDELMTRRIALLKKHNISMKDLQHVIAEMGPLDGARDYLDWLRARVPVIILSDTFYEFALPLMPALGFPCLFCHTLSVDQKGMITNYHLRTKDGKKGAVTGFQKNGFWVLAIGDSYNDTTMLEQADRGILFRAPKKVLDEFPQYDSCSTFTDLQAHLSNSGI